MSDRDQAVRRRFAGRSAIVTGSSQGIGRAIALRLAREGASVVVNARNATALAAVATEIADFGGEVVAVVGGVADDSTPHQLVEAAMDSFGRIDVVVNNVGISPYFGPLMQVDRERFSKTVLSNTWPAIALVQAAVKAGLGNDRGAVLNVSTIGAQQVQPSVAPYTSSKSALDVLTKNMAHELARQGVRVNGVAPGLIRTRTSSVVSSGALGDAEAELIPLGRLGEPDDVAAAAAFLLSDDASWITGVTLVVDGGRLLVGHEPAGQIGVFEPRPQTIDHPDSDHATAHQFEERP